MIKKEKKYKLPSSLTVTFCLNLVYLFVGFLGGHDVVIASSVVIFVILSVSAEILDAIHKQLAK
jgi:hypothetical protein